MCDKRAESRGSLKSVQITQGAVSQYDATAELSIIRGVLIYDN